MYTMLFYKSTMTDDIKINGKTIHLRAKINMTVKTQLTSFSIFTTFTIIITFPAKTPYFIIYHPKLNYTE